MKHLCEVCTRLRDVAIPHLYQSLVLRVPEQSLLEGLVAVLQAIPRDYLKHTREFGFNVPIHKRVESRCVHGGDGHISDEAVQDGVLEFLTNDENMGHQSPDNDDIDKDSGKVSKITCQSVVSHS